MVKRNPLLHNKSTYNLLFPIQLPRLPKQFHQLPLLNVPRLFEDFIKDLFVRSVIEVLIDVPQFISVPETEEHTFFDAASGNASGPDETDASFAVEERNIIRDFFFAMRREIFFNELAEYIDDESLVLGEEGVEVGEGLDFREGHQCKCECEFTTRTRGL